MSLPPAVHAEFENWSRACWSGSWPHPLPVDRAMSAEGRYTPEAGDVFDPPEPRPPKPNFERAEIVQMVFKERLTHRERLVVIAEYTQRHASGRAMRPGDRSEHDGISRAARSRGLSVRLYTEALRCAGRQVEMAFEEVCA